jgi:hypothetical protein
LLNSIPVIGVPVGGSSTLESIINHSTLRGPFFLSLYSSSNMSKKISSPCHGRNYLYIQLSKIGIWRIILFLIIIFGNVQSYLCDLRSYTLFVPYRKCVVVPCSPLSPPPLLPGVRHAGNLHRHAEPTAEAAQCSFLKLLISPGHLKHHQLYGPLKTS